MLNLYWEFSVLSRSVAYQNLSGASLHVGLSQPQLSRIVAKLEAELKVILLDRSARRKSTWTPLAFRLAELYSNSNRKLNGDINNLVKLAEPTHLCVGTLEGIVSLSLHFCHSLLRTASIRMMELNVHDLNRLEEHFLGGELDVIFTSRPPGRKKYKYSREVGYQTLDRIRKNSTTQVMSSFEFETGHGSLPDDECAKVFVSNSLEVRKSWISQYGGVGQIPSSVSKQKPQKDAQAVLVIATDQLSPQLWERIARYKM